MWPENNQKYVLPHCSLRKCKLKCTCKYTSMAKVKIMTDTNIGGNLKSYNLLVKQCANILKNCAVTFYKT